MAKKSEQKTNFSTEDRNADKKSACCGSEKNWKNNGSAAGGGAVYGLGLIGAFIYFMQQANSVWTVIFGIFKAIFWPAYLVYHALLALHL